MIDGNEILDLMYTPIYDEKMLKVMEDFEMEVPKLDERYEIEGKISVSDRDNSGITFIFQELDKYSQNGDPVLKKIDFENRAKLPFSLEYSDDYQTCCKKLGKKADYINTHIKKSKIWTFLTKEGKEYSLTINFIDGEHLEINYILVGSFDRSRIGRILIENED